MSTREAFDIARQLGDVRPAEGLAVQQHQKPMVDEDLAEAQKVHSETIFSTAFATFAHGKLPSGEDNFYNLILHANYRPNKNQETPRSQRGSHLRLVA